MKIQDARSHKSLLSFGVAALLAVGAAGAQVAFAASSSDSVIDNSGSYQHEVQSCLSGRTQEDQPTCLREARNAEAAKRRGVLHNNGDLQANATARCDVFTTSSDKADCESRVLGAPASGNVAGGGELLESERTITIPANEMGNR